LEQRRGILFLFFRNSQKLDKSGKISSIVPMDVEVLVEGVDGVLPKKEARKRAKKRISAVKKSAKEANKVRKSEIVTKDACLELGLKSEAHVALGVSRVCAEMDFNPVKEMINLYKAAGMELPYCEKVMEKMGIMEFQRKIVDSLGAKVQKDEHVEKGVNEVSGNVFNITIQGEYKKEDEIKGVIDV